MDWAQLSDFEQALPLPGGKIAVEDQFALKLVNLATCAFTVRAFLGGG